MAAIDAHTMTAEVESCSNTAEHVLLALRQLRAINDRLKSCNAASTIWLVGQQHARARLTYAPAGHDEDTKDSHNAHDDFMTTSSIWQSGLLRAKFQGRRGICESDDWTHEPVSSSCGAQVSRLQQQIADAESRALIAEERLRDCIAQNEELQIARDAMLQEMAVSDDAEARIQERLQLRHQVASQRACIACLEDSLAQVKEERNQLQATRDSEIDAHRHLDLEGATISVIAGSKSPRLSNLIHALDRGGHQRKLEGAHTQLSLRRQTEAQLMHMSSQLVDLHGQLDMFQKTLVAHPSTKGLLDVDRLIISQHARDTEPQPAV